MSGISNLNVLAAMGKVRANEQANKQANAKKTLGQEDFLKLMVAQMSQQDPTNPVNSSDFMGQIAQFGTVEGIGRLQQTLANISAGVFSNQALQASTMVGRNVYIASNQGVLQADKGLKGAVSSDYKLNDIKVTISDENDKPIKVINLGAHEPGVIDFTWNGIGSDGKTYPAGSYKISATATINNMQTNLQTLAYANVDSVTMGQGDSNVWLNLGDLGSTKINDVWKIA